MNERIRELSYEAQRYALNNTTGLDLAGLNELWQEKFAELIVQECAELSVNSQYINNKSEYYEGFNEALIYAGNKIKQHFGVEE